MASYFELPPQQKAAAANIQEVPEDQREQFGSMSFLSPALTQLLDDLGDEHSDSSSEEASVSEGSIANKTTKQQKDAGKKYQESKAQTSRAPAVPSSLSPRRGSLKSSPRRASGHVKIVSAHSGGGHSTKPKPRQPHIARFHSLRSMLFSATIEDKMQVATEADCEQEASAAQAWKAQHEKRQMHRPRTPEKDPQDKDGIGGRIKTRLRRITSKEGPSMGSIQEGKTSDFSDNVSTASSDNEPEPEPYIWKPREADEESIHHSDVEDLVRWVSRRDPPSDGEARKAKDIPIVKEDSGHESLGHSDVEDLVRFASRKSVNDGAEHTGYSNSDASTASDSEHLQATSEDEDPEDLVRWVSHREGPKAGPVREQTTVPDSTQDISRHDSDIPELGQHVRRFGNRSPTRSPKRQLEVPDDEPERGRPRSRSGSPAVEHKDHMSHHDVDELVRWVSRKEIAPNEPTIPQSDSKTLPLLEADNEAKKAQLGIHNDPGSLSHLDLPDLIAHVRSRGAPEPAEEPETNPNHTEQDDPSIAQIQQSEAKMKKQLGMSHDDGSLSHSDLQSLVEHVRSKSPLADTQIEPQVSEPLKLPSDSLPVPEEKPWVEGKERTPSLGDEDVDELVRWVSRKA